MNIEQNITRYIDLKNNDGLCAYQNHAAQQNHNAFRKFFDLIEKIKPAQILEIGTALGGFTQFLSICIKNLDLKTTILTYDIYEKPWYSELISNGIDVRIQNIFDFVNNKLLDNYVADYINRIGTTLVLCDGGSKIQEFNILSPYLKNGDIIMAHDYSINKMYFETNIQSKIWNWHEIQYSDIEDSIKAYNLIPYDQDNFQSVAWGSFIKNDNL